MIYQRDDKFRTIAIIGELYFMELSYLHSLYTQVWTW